MGNSRPRTLFSSRVFLLDAFALIHAIPESHDIKEAQDSTLKQKPQSYLAPLTFEEAVTDILTKSTTIDTDKGEKQSGNAGEVEQRIAADLPRIRMK